MTNTLEQIKDKVKQHTIVPFNTQHITCESNKLIIDNKYTARNTKQLMDTLGIRTNLTKEIFAKPAENWDAIRTALSSIDKNKQFACIVDRHNNVNTLVTSSVKENTELNFDQRLDELFNTIDNNINHNLQRVEWNNETCNVEVHTTGGDDINCGLGDLWKFGTTSIIGHASQQFANYFLRLICSNGMTTREQLAYRVAAVSKNIGKQFLKFANNDTMISSIKPRVDNLRGARASLYEVNCIANVLNKEERERYMPQYASIVADFANAGHPIDSLSAKRQKFVYTEENLYDVFNLATNLASHERSVIGTDAAMRLNKSAGDIFTNGPNLTFNVLDIYKN